jgi:hypothetical protein
MASERGQAAQVATVVAPPREAVLPLWGYALLAAELGGLVWLHHAHPEESGGDRYGYLLGWTGLMSMVVMHVYSLRRRIRAMAGWGRLRSWLRFHIFLGLQGALLVTYHSLHLHDVKTVQGANIICVAVVVLSGIFGRYVYSLLPKSISGDRLSTQQIEAEIRQLSAANQDVRAVVKRREMLQRRLATLSSAERVFRYWTILHKPLTFILLAATVLHILAHYMYASGMSG